MRYKLKLYDYDDECIAIIEVNDEAVLNQLIEAIKETGYMIYTYENV